MKDTLIEDLRRFCASISGRLMLIDGPYKDRQGHICYFAILKGERVRKFRSSDRAEEFKNKHNAKVGREAMP